MMAYEYWGYITRHDDGTWREKQYLDGPAKLIDPNKLSEEFKTKIAMMDFMNDYDELPCGSHKVHYNGLKLLAYFLFTEVSSTRGAKDGI